MPKMTLRLLGGPMHLQKVSVEASMEYSSPPMPVERFHTFEYIPEEGREKVKGYFTDGELATTYLCPREAHYKCVPMAGEKGMVYPLLIYSDWEINDALEFLCFGTERVFLEED